MSGSPIDQKRLLDAIIDDMLKPVHERFLGPQKMIYAYVDIAGSCGPLDLLNGLDKKASARYFNMFTTICGGGYLRGEKWHTWDQKGLSCYKDNTSQTRIVHTTEQGRVHVLLYGFGGKKENKVKPKHVLAAERQLAEYQKRVQAVIARIRRER